MMRLGFTLRMLSVAACLALVVPVTHAVRSDLAMKLEFTPTTMIGAVSHSLSSVARPGTLDVRVVDGRTVTDPTLVGEATDDDDTRFEVKATNDVGKFADRVVRKLASDWGLRLSSPAKATLVVSVTKWFATERNQALGSMYSADVVLRGELEDAAGRVLWSGVSSGGTRRYGRKQSPANYNEIFSDAMQESLGGLLSERSLHKALEEVATAPAPVTATARPAGENVTRQANAATPEERLREVKELLRKEFSEAFVIDFVRGATYTRPMTTDDLVTWKEDGVPEAVIRTAFERSNAGRP